MLLHSMFILKLLIALLALVSTRVAIKVSVWPGFRPRPSLKLVLTTRENVLLRLVTPLSEKIHFVSSCHTVS